MQRGHVWHDCVIYRGGMARPEGFEPPGFWFAVCQIKVHSTFFGIAYE